MKTVQERLDELGDENNDPLLAGGEEAEKQIIMLASIVAVGFLALLVFKIVS